MKNRAKARFKGAMRFIRSHEDSLRKDSLAKKLLCKNAKEFWKEIKRMRSKVSLPNVIDGVTGSDRIYLILSRSCDLDGVSAEHLKHSSNRIVPRC